MKEYTQKIYLGSMVKISNFIPVSIDLHALWKKIIIKSNIYDAELSELKKSMGNGFKLCSISDEMTDEKRGMG